MRKITYGALVVLTTISLMACAGEKKSEKKTEETKTETDEVVSEIETTKKEETPTSFNPSWLRKVKENKKETETVKETEAIREPEDEKNSQLYLGSSADTYGIQYGFEWDENSIEISELKGKRLCEVIKEGYNYTCYMNANGIHCLCFEKKNVDDERVNKILEELGNMTVKEYIESKYFEDFFGEIDFEKSGNDYIFSSNIGGVYFSFSLDDCSEIISQYKDDTFATADEMEELYDKKMLNVTLDHIECYMILDESANEFFELEDFEFGMISDCTVDKMYYKILS